MPRKKVRLIASVPYELAANKELPLSITREMPIEKSKEITIDILNMDLQQMLVNLKNNVNKKPSWTIFLRGRENVKIGLTNEKIELLIEQISKIRRMGREFLELQADAICSKELLGLLAEDKLTEFKLGVALKLEEHKSKIHTLKVTRKKEKLELINIQLEHAHKKAQIDFLNAQTEEQKQHARIAEMIVGKVAKMSDGAKLSLYHDLTNRNKQTANTAPEKDYDLNEHFKEFRIKLFDEEVHQKKAETKSKKAEADLDKYNADRKMGKI
ncbi:MAG: hypothetical protein K1X86_15920 [Ignavibacteria bacterium]|nr:hypothetical protein [Ignavibacteria bacterium]